VANVQIAAVEAVNPPRAQLGHWALGAVIPQSHRQAACAPFASRIGMVEPVQLSNVRLVQPDRGDPQRFTQQMEGGRRCGWCCPRRRP
jgi:hypothetical protein